MPGVFAISAKGGADGLVEIASPGPTAWQLAHVCSEYASPMAAEPDVSSACGVAGSVAQAVSASVAIVARRLE